MFVLREVMFATKPPPHAHILCSNLDMNMLPMVGVSLMGFSHIGSQIWLLVLYEQEALLLELHPTSWCQISVCRENQLHEVCKYSMLNKAKHAVLVPKTVV